MTTYTAADFEAAKFATHPDGGLAMRDDPCDTLPWDLGRGECHSDAEMARFGWSPAHVVTTPREALATLVYLAYKPEGETIAPGTGYLTVWNDGDVASTLAGSNHPTNAHEPDLFRLLLDPPTPAWQNADIVEAGTEDNPVRRMFLRDGKRYWTESDGVKYLPSDLIDPQPLTVTR